MGKDKEGGHVSRLWDKHGGGYYAIVAVVTFLYLEVVDLWSGISAADGLRDFLASEMVTFWIESFINTVWASIWPVHWFSEGGWIALLSLGVGYLLWTGGIAWALDRRQEALKKELGL